MNFDILEILGGTEPDGILFMVDESCFGLFNNIGHAVPAKMTTKWNPASDNKIELKCLYPDYSPLQLYLDPFNKLIDNGHITVYSTVH